MSYLLSTAEVEQLLQLVNQSEKIIITSHKSPDGDAIGSALAMYHVLKSVGKQPVVILPDNVPYFLQFLQGYPEIVIFENAQKQAANLIAEAELIFSLDYNNLSRVGASMEAALRNASAKFVLIDHHQQPEGFAAVTYSDTSACSTAELVYKTVIAAGWKTRLNIAAAECIYAGIMTDSGSFRFPSVTKGTHEIAGELIALGMDHARIHREIYDNNSLNRMRLVGYALSQKLEVLPECATAIISLSQEELLSFNAQSGDTESLVNQALSIQGVKLSAFFREDAEKVKISFRSKGSFDVNTFARNGWNGGGHMNAAGGSFPKPMHDAIERFKQQCIAIKEQIAQS